MCINCENSKFPELDVNEVNRLKKLIIEVINKEILSIKTVTECLDSKKWEAIEYVLKNVLEYVKIRKELKQYKEELKV